MGPSSDCRAAGLGHGAEGIVVTPGRDTKRLLEATHRLTGACLQRAQVSWFIRRERKPEDTLDFAHTDVKRALALSREEGLALTGSSLTITVEASGWSWK